MRSAHGRMRLARPGRGPTPGLVRIHLPSGRDGWRATARLPSGAVEKVFLDERHATPGAARAAANGWRGLRNFARLVCPTRNRAASS